MLVLVETDEANNVHQVKDGLDWLLEILEILPETSGFDRSKPLSSLVKQEKRRVEAWRQEMAAKNLELTRQQIELETQRQQLKELELKLKQAKVAL
jgi:septal ring factor EnvC (AmiA/AmiB activator)